LAVHAESAPAHGELLRVGKAVPEAFSFVPLDVGVRYGFFKKYGINSTVSKGASWAAIRDSLMNGDIQATHMLAGMPIASRALT